MKKGGPPEALRFGIPRNKRKVYERMIGVGIREVSIVLVYSLLLESSLFPSLLLSQAPPFSSESSTGGFPARDWLPLSGPLPRSLLCCLPPLRFRLSTTNTL